MKKHCDLRPLAQRASRSALFLIGAAWVAACSTGTGASSASSEGLAKAPRPSWVPASELSPDGFAEALRAEAGRLVDQDARWVLETFLFRVKPSQRELANRSLAKLATEARSLYVDRCSDFESDLRQLCVSASLRQALHPQAEPLNVVAYLKVHKRTLSGILAELEKPSAASVDPYVKDIYWDYATALLAELWASSRDKTDDRFEWAYFPNPEDVLCVAVLHAQAEERPADFETKYQQQDTPENYWAVSVPVHHDQAERTRNDCARLLPRTLNRDERALLVASGVDLVPTYDRAKVWQHACGELKSPAPAPSDFSPEASRWRVLDMLVKQDLGPKGCDVFGT